MYRNIKYNEYSQEMLDQLPRGAFLTTKNEDKLNTMTIGWGSIGFIWNKPVFMVAVRYSRYTYEMLENAKEFSVSVPLKGNLKEELGICGTKSRREIDKFKVCELTPKESKIIDTPIIDECELHYECKVVYQQTMEPGMLNKEIKDQKYPNYDYHVLYYGEIVASYIKE
ncbi:flavin reductase family protein [Clostridium sp. D2Q-11]|uniref:Flavin reductase family protein n=1 Tax=Anaeromonas frigoriresistens TaxID=2683708 RepID=A0A942Z5S4_9FIRM|nr:flavin reductase family protein [Anaeromonas frigoriresistens]MBS4537741.1 flavin reductase family protein [Anaeromonas frigoriresistens]